MFVFDATPLISLARADRISLLAELEADRLLPEVVYDEVVETGIAEGYPDARRIERCVNDGVLTVVTVSESDTCARLRDNPNLSDADAAVLACAHQRDAVAVMDESAGRDAAAAEGITTRGTAYVVLKLAREGAIDVDAARGTIDAMIEEGWYCAPDVYAKIVRTLDSIQG